MHVVDSVLDVVLDLPKDVIDLLLRLDEDLQRGVVGAISGAQQRHLGAIVGPIARHQRQRAVYVSGHKGGACSNVSALTSITCTQLKQTKQMKRCAL